MTDPGEATNPTGILDEGERLLSTNEAAALIGIPVATLRWWRHARRGPRSFALAGRVLYRRTDLETWVADAYEAEAEEWA